MKRLHSNSKKTVCMVISREDSIMTTFNIKHTNQTITVVRREIKRGTGCGYPTTLRYNVESMVVAVTHERTNKNQMMRIIHYIQAQVQTVQRSCGLDGATNYRRVICYDGSDTCFIRSLNNTAARCLVEFIYERKDLTYNSHFIRLRIDKLNAINRLLQFALFIRVISQANPNPLVTISYPTLRCINETTAQNDPIT